ncbi:hypothetical protein [Streptomyces pinistramenti]|uniref:hypothetical protein n=1 Tax=Streptomyces pinistramenti TaxID=2884812 RepID=UPI001D06A3FA|nr:hypothetical protein [Streptomyces pinistramenti]MCB5907439.1 hypothetical protein [Streptomyces pinistramenti]
MHERLAPRPLRPAGPAGQRSRAARVAPWPAAVAVAFALVQLAFVVPGSGLGWDETVYVSQVGHHAPAAFFSAPRARGISYLVAPLAALTTSTAVLRVYLVVLSSAGLFGALWVWRKVFAPPVLACAGALFAGLWPTLFYGSAAMPNLWCALGALAGVGFLVRACDGPGDRAAPVGVAGSVAVVTLMRPADGLWLALPAAVAVLLMPGLRRPALGVALPAGLLVGGASWVVEAYTRYGGLGARLHRASEIQGGLGWHFAVDDQVRALAGRTLCRPCDVPWDAPHTAVWWCALPVLAAGGVLAGVRAHRTAAVVLPCAVAAALAFPYLFLIGYAAPRFLLPVYALLALPVAVCVVHLCTAAGRPVRRTVSCVVLAVALAGHLGVQFQVLSRVASGGRSTGRAYTQAASALHRLGLRAPCTLSGEHAVPLAYYTGCASRQTDGHDMSSTPAGLAAVARRMPVAVIAPAGGRPPPFARAWRPVDLPRLPGPVGAYRAYLPPDPARR